MMTRVVSAIVIGWSWLLALSTLPVNGQHVQFDCPALVTAKTIDFFGGQKIIDVVVPVSVATGDPDFELSEIEAEVCWNRFAYRNVDYAPKTTLQSPVDGPIDVERNRQTSFKIGTKLSVTGIDFLSPSVDGHWATENGEVRRFREIPQASLLISSGSIHRGTGASFRFFPSRTETLEGGRNVVLSYEVPISWRGGILQVTFNAEIERKNFSLFAQSDRESAVYMVPVYLEGDEQARYLASSFSRLEQQLRRHWYEMEKQNGGNRQWSSWQHRHSQPNLVGSDWLQKTIRSGEPGDLEQIAKLLPDRIANAAESFLLTRQQLIELSR